MTIVGSPPTGALWGCSREGCADGQRLPRPGRAGLRATGSASSTSPTSPPTSWGELTYARGRASGPGRRPPGSTRSASAAASGSRSSSQNSARLLTVVLRRQRLGPGARADQLPARRRRGRATSSSTRAPRCCSSIPSSTTRCRGVDGRAPLRDRRRDRRRSCYRFERRARAVAEPDEDATATINYTSGTTARPEGRAADAPQHLDQRRRRSAGRSGVNDRDVYLHTLPMFHCNGWGMPYAVTGMGGRHVVLRKVDGAEILRRVEQHGVTLHVRRARGRRRGPRRRRDVGRADPGRRHACASSWPARRRRRGRSSGSRPSSAGSSSRSTGSPRRRRCSR